MLSNTPLHWGGSSCAHSFSICSISKSDGISAPSAAANTCDSNVMRKSAITASLQAALTTSVKLLCAALWRCAMSTAPSSLTRKRNQSPEKQHQRREEKQEAVELADAAPGKRRRSTALDEKDNLTASQTMVTPSDSPEGELFFVTVKTWDELLKSDDVAADAHKLDQLLRQKQLAMCTATLDDADLSWGYEFEALDLLRRFAKHHLTEARRQLSNDALVTLVLPAVLSLRSAMARNALLTIQDLIIALRAEMTDHLHIVVPVLLNRACSEKQFLKDLAREVLDTTLQAEVDEALLKPLLAVSATERNAQIISVAGLYVTKCVIRMDRDHLRKFVLETRETFFDEIAAFLSCKVIECKAATRRTCQYTRRVIGNDEFVALIKKKLSGSAQLDVLKASEIRKAIKFGQAKPSVRERMLQMKKQQQQQKKVQSGCNDISVVVVAQPRSKSSLTQAAPSL
ncbi:hypothetical protein CCR75_008255 [Bremia lactucae]|uniref:CLASP N-terminal domain-containing protein n=1 Tax=Bremia lactucae TaxID=4779 RepID=A0A976FQX0_BRELC|nr:hypothetical protein CCR75_008255 [Bremia lactucae]